MHAEPSESFSIRPATEDDIPGCLQVERVSYPTPWTEQHFQSEFTKPYSRFWVITDDETDEAVAGYIVFWVMGEECHLLNLSVGQAFRRQGFAKRLLQALVREALRLACTKVWLEVRRSNGPAIALYESVGFAVGRIRKQFYSDGEDALVLELDLTDSEELKRLDQGEDPGTDFHN
jgi:ribosomal-protein-alanine N-acetyltransferase